MTSLADRRDLLVAYDLGKPYWLELVPEYAAFWAALVRAVELRGLRIVDAATLDSGTADLGHVLLVSYGWGPLSRALVGRRARPVVLVNWEPPVIDFMFYARLRTISSLFPHTFLYPGARPRVARSTHFHETFLPQLIETPEPDDPSDRMFMTMIVATKFPARPSLKELLRALALHAIPRRSRSGDPSVRHQLIRFSDPDLRVELGSERLRAIAHFARSPDFVLYGRGWDRARVDGVPPATLAAARSRYAGAPSDKIATLRRFRFALSFENTVFPGAISEKIFNCFAAGCIPVYYGAPDISRYVPAETFIDFRDFRSYPELEQHLRSMSPETAERMRAAARGFLASPSFRELFSAERLAERIADALTSTVGADHSRDAR